MLHPPLPIPERILSFGPPGSGKTTGWLQIARLSQQTGSPAFFHVIDTDFAAARMLSGYDLSNVIVHEAMDWPDYLAALDKIKTSIHPGDWIVVDFISNAWSAVQSHFVERVFHQDLDEYFLAQREQLEAVRAKIEKAGKTPQLQPFDGWMDWNVINAMYRKWALTILFRLPGVNIYAVAKGEPIGDRDDAQTRALFASFGAKPVGQKDLPYQFHSVLLAASNPRGGWTLTTVKDRERSQLSGSPVTSFAKTYLLEVAGWKLTGGAAPPPPPRTGP